MKGFIEERRKAGCCKRDDFLNVLLSTEKMKASAVCPKGTCSGWACHGLVSHVFSRHIFAWLQVSCISSRSRSRSTTGRRRTGGGRKGGINVSARACGVRGRGRHRQFGVSD